MLDLAGSTHLLGEEATKRVIGWDRGVLQGMVQGQLRPPRESYHQKVPAGPARLEVEGGRQG
eukprot:SAG22_NODE_166_length_16765_cov_30.782791_11_plen_62_part_00